eukprot:Hpha_TRINITY_DN5775_c0_g1::TRINITY_DN5775_c0_g1_i1::g.147585::m.147585
MLEPSRKAPVQFVLGTYAPPPHRSLKRGQLTQVLTVVPGPAPPAHIIQEITLLLHNRLLRLGLFHVIHSRTVPRIFRRDGQDAGSAQFAGHVYIPKLAFREPHSVSSVQRVTQRNEGGRCLRRVDLPRVTVEECQRRCERLVPQPPGVQVPRRQPERQRPRGICLQRPPRGHLPIPVVRRIWLQCELPTRRGTVQTFRAPRLVQVQLSIQLVTVRHDALLYNAPRAPLQYSSLESFLPGFSRLNNTDKPLSAKIGQVCKAMVRTYSTHSASLITNEGFMGTPFQGRSSPVIPYGTCTAAIILRTS